MQGHKRVGSNNRVAKHWGNCWSSRTERTGWFRWGRTGPQGEDQEVVGRPENSKRGWGAQKNSRSFFSSPAPMFALFVSLWVSSRGILVVLLKRWDPEMCTFGLPGCRVKPGGFGADHLDCPGFHTRARELQTCYPVQLHEHNVTASHAVTLGWNVQRRMLIPFTHLVRMRQGTQFPTQ